MGNWEEAGKIGVGNIGACSSIRCEPFLLTFFPKKLVEFSQKKYVGNFKLYVEKVCGN